MTADPIFKKSCLRAGLLVLVLLGLAACSEPPVSEPTEVPQAQPEVSTVSTPPPRNQGLSPEQMGQWSRNCALCHVRGEGGAPVVGDREAWDARQAQGEAVLLEHTVAGLNNMPPLGYCMDCEEEDFLALIRFMGGER